MTFNIDALSIGNSTFVEPTKSLELLMKLDVLYAPFWLVITPTYDEVFDYFQFLMMDFHNTDPSLINFYTYMLQIPEQASRYGCILCHLMIAQSYIDTKYLGNVRMNRFNAANNDGVDIFDFNKELVPIMKGPGIATKVLSDKSRLNINMLNDDLFENFYNNESI